MTCIAIFGWAFVCKRHESITAAFSADVYVCTQPAWVGRYIGTSGMLDLMEQKDMKSEENYRAKKLCSWGI